MSKRFIPYLILLYFVACAKEGVKIGRENPEVEIEKCVALSKKKHYEEAVECLEIFKSRFPQTTEGQEASLRIADTYFVQHQYLLAAETYLSFVELHPLHPRSDYALYRAGLSYFKEAPKAIDRDQEYLLKAKETLQRALRVSYQSTYEELIAKTIQVIDERLAERVFYVGRFYFRTGEYLSAIPRFEDLLEKYPKAEVAPRTLYYLVRSHLELDREEEARLALQKMVEDFPENDWTKKAQRHYSAIVR